MCDHRTLGGSVILFVALHAIELAVAPGIAWSRGRTIAAIDEWDLTDQSAAGRIGKPQVETGTIAQMVAQLLDLPRIAAHVGAAAPSRAAGA